MFGVLSLGDELLCQGLTQGSQVTFRKTLGVSLDVEVWEKARRAQEAGALSGSHLHGVLRELPLQAFINLASQIDEGPKKLVRDLKMEVNPTFIIAPASTVGRCLRYGAPHRTQHLVIQTPPGCTRRRGGGKGTPAPPF